MQHTQRQLVNKHLPQGLGIKNYVPYQQQQYTNQGAQNQQGTQNQSQSNTYTAGQQGLQGNLGQLYQQLLGGNIPSSFTNPQAAINAYNTNFQQSVAPNMASQLGAGSPAIQSANSLGLAQLQGQLYNTGVNNYMNALGQGTNYAFNPTGSTGTQTGQQQGTFANQGTQTVATNPLVFLANLLGGLGGGP